MAVLAQQRTFKHCSACVSPNPVIATKCASCTTPLDSPRSVDKHPAEIGMNSPKSDPCVHVYSESGGIYIVSLCVDAVLLLGNVLTMLETIKRNLMGHFSMNDTGGVSLVLGMGVTRGHKRKTVTYRKTHTKSVSWRRGGRQLLLPVQTRRYR